MSLDDPGAMVNQRTPGTPGRGTAGHRKEYYRWVPKVLRKCLNQHWDHQLCLLLFSQSFLLFTLNSTSRTTCSTPNSIVIIVANCVQLHPPSHHQAMGHRPRDYPWTYLAEEKKLKPNYFQGNRLEPMRNELYKSFRAMFLCLWVKLLIRSSMMILDKTTKTFVCIIVCIRVNGYHIILAETAGMRRCKCRTKAFRLSSLANAIPA